MEEGGGRSLYTQRPSFTRQFVTIEKASTITWFRFRDGWIARIGSIRTREHPSSRSRSSPPLPFRSSRRARKAWRYRLFSFFLFSGPPPSIFDNRLSLAARGKGIARIPDRIPCALPTPDLFMPGCISLRNRGAWTK